MLNCGNKNEEINQLKEMLMQTMFSAIYYTIEIFAFLFTTITTSIIYNFKLQHYNRLQL